MRRNQVHGQSRLLKEKQDFQLLQFLELVRGSQSPIGERPIRVKQTNPPLQMVPGRTEHLRPPPTLPSARSRKKSYVSQRHLHEGGEFASTPRRQWSGEREDHNTLPEGTGPSSCPRPRNQNTAASYNRNPDCFPLKGTDETGEHVM